MKEKELGNLAEWHYEYHTTFEKSDLIVGRISS